MGAMALALGQREVRERARRVRERKAAHAGHWYWTTPPPYGYVTVGERGRRGLVAHPAECRSVREIFDRYDAGQSFGSIAGELQRRRVPTRRGGPRSQAAVRTILRSQT